MAASRTRLAKKWLDQIPPTASISAAAREAIESRASAVLHYMPLAAKQAHKNVEYVHQMRVATRRACAAIDALRAALPPKRVGRCYKLLRKVRRSSGRARDLDVMIGRLNGRADNEIGAGPKARLTEALRVRRKAVQPRMRKKLERIDARELARQFDQLQNKIRWRGEGPEPDWKTATTNMLGRVAAGLHAAGKPLEGQGDNGDRIEEIHRLRICGKELRYTMEIAVGAFGEPLRDLYGFIEQTQARLGTINDHAVALDFYQTWYDRESDPSIREAIKTVVAIERDGLKSTLRDFPHWWSDQQVGQFWEHWQEVVGSLPSESPTDDDSRFQKKGA